MKIHSSHTKKDLIEVIETFNFKIEDYSVLSKGYLFKVVEAYIDCCDKFESLYSNLPTCLRAVNLINKSGKFKNKFEPITTGKTKILIRKKKEKKFKLDNILITKTKEDNGGNPFILYFD